MRFVMNYMEICSNLVNTGEICDRNIVLTVTSVPKLCVATRWGGGKELNK
jgi:hypothetical protein